MPLRFIDTGFYKHPFIAGLKTAHKCFYSFVFCDCDNSGVWSPDFQIASHYVGVKLDPASIRKDFSGKFRQLKNGKWFFPDFIQWQYPKGLSAKNPAHSKVIAELLKHDLIDENLVLKGLERDPISPSKGTKDKEEDKGMGKDMEKDKEEPAKNHRYVQAIIDTCINIPKLQFQLTNEQAETLEREFGDVIVKDVIDSMENSKDLVKKYQSVYLTARNWCKRRLSDGTVLKLKNNGIIKRLPTDLPGSATVESGKAYGDLRDCRANGSGNR